jgi:hypothetical protein
MSCQGEKMMPQALTPLTGVNMSPQFFQFEETSELSPALAVDVLAGRRFGVIFRNVIPVATQKETTATFWASPALTRRTGEPSYHVGTYSLEQTDRHLFGGVRRGHRSGHGRAQRRIDWLRP